MPYLRTVLVAVVGGALLPGTPYAAAEEGTACVRIGVTESLCRDTDPKILLALVPALPVAAHPARGCGGGPRRSCRGYRQRGHRGRALFGLLSEAQAWSLRAPQGLEVVRAIPRLRRRVPSRPSKRSHLAGLSA